MRATAVKPAGSWHGEAADSVVLDYDDRCRRRLSITTTKGLPVLLDWPEPVTLRHGDALALDDGQLIEVLAAPEPLLEIRAADPHHFARLAWHLGNRHLPTQLMRNALRIRRDHVIADMAARLGAKVREIDAPFDPEGGAYAETNAHAHHGHDQDHSHDHHHGHHHD
jgi:urease accessory protein